MFKKFNKRDLLFKLSGVNKETIELAEVEISNEKLKEIAYKRFFPRYFRYKKAGGIKGIIKNKFNSLKIVKKYKEFKRKLQFLDYLENDYGHYNFNKKIDERILARDQNPSDALLWSLSGVMRPIETENGLRLGYKTKKQRIYDAECEYWFNKKKEWDEAREELARQEKVLAEKEENSKTEETKPEDIEISDSNLEEKNNVKTTPSAPISPIPPILYKDIDSNNIFDKNHIKKYQENEYRDAYDIDKDGNLYNRSVSEGTRIYRIDNSELKAEITKLDPENTVKNKNTNDVIHDEDKTINIIEEPNKHVSVKTVKNNNWYKIQLNAEIIYNTVNLILEQHKPNDVEVLTEIIDKLEENIKYSGEASITQIYESEKHKKYFNSLYISSFVQENIINVENVDDWTYDEIKNAFIAIKEIRKMVDKLNQ